MILYMIEMKKENELLKSNQKDLEARIREIETRQHHEKILIIKVLLFQFNFSQITLQFHSLKTTNDGVYNSSINNGNVEKIDMRYDGDKGLTKKWLQKWELMPYQ